MRTATSSCPSASTPEPAGAAFAARELTLADVRCWARGRIELPEGLTVLSGPNGAGKTSLVEAVVLGCLGVSPRTAREAEIVRRGAEALHVALRLDGPGGTRLREIGFAAGVGRRLRIDEEPVRGLARWRVPGSVLVFIPEELRAVKGPPGARRRHLDRLLEAAAPGYADDLAAYGTALAQRNALLRRVRAGASSPDGLRPWERQLAEHGARLVVARREAIAALRDPFSAQLRALGGGEGGLGLEPSPAWMADVPDDEVAEALLAGLEHARQREIGAAQTLAGPHRDDVLVEAAGLDLRRLGSQGEQRTAVLALLLAHRAHLAARGPAPILLLDDVMSELDPERRERLLEEIGGAGQAVVTSADPDAAALGARHAEATLRIEDGRVVG
jgi:DNA replication and repair protein RecF